MAAPIRFCCKGCFFGLRFNLGSAAQFRRLENPAVSPSKDPIAPRMSTATVCRSSRERAAISKSGRIGVSGDHEREESSHLRFPVCLDQ
jgi:hypothetical protein